MTPIILTATTPVITHNNINSMNAPDVSLYLRRTDGTGEAITLGARLPAYKLYQLASTRLHCTGSLELYHRGIRIDPGEASIVLQQGDIVHAREGQGEGLEQGIKSIRVYCPKGIYCYSAGSEGRVEGLRASLAELLGCRPEHVVVAHLGRILDDADTFANLGIRNNDMVSASVCAKPLPEPAEPRLKAKAAESVTMTPSDPVDICQAHEQEKKVMRKSSMKSSGEEKEHKEKQRKQLGVSRARSQSSANTDQNMKKSQEQFNIFKCPWSINTKLLQTQTIYCDDEDLDNDPDFWTDCKIELASQDKTMTYVLDCNKQHTLSNIVRAISRCERVPESSVKIRFQDSNAQRMALENVTMLAIAKMLNSRVITCVEYSTKLQ